jgi:hypothetical protein
MVKIQPGLYLSCKVRNEPTFLEEEDRTWGGQGWGQLPGSEDATGCPGLWPAQVWRISCICSQQTSFCSNVRVVPPTLESLNVNS